MTRLTLTQFRNYDQARIESDGRPMVLCGPNGAGKTNLLEAVSFLAPGRGLRRARLADVTRLEAPPPAGWAVAAELLTGSGPLQIGTGRDGADTGDRRTVRIDGRKLRGQIGLAEHVAVVWLTPAMDRLFIEGTAGRRRFLDRLVFGLDPGHAGRLGRYEQALRERGRLLKLGRRDDAWLSGLEDIMATSGVAVAAARRAVITRLHRACAAASGPFPAAGMQVEGVLERQLDTQAALVVEDGFRQRLAESRDRDAVAGTATLGPHRSDFLVHHAGHDRPAALCSTGEQKALLIAIVLANARLTTAERGFAPLLLLDEVAAHLDPPRRMALFEAILALGAQAWLTGTDRGLFAGFGDRVQTWQVEAARLAPA